MARTGLTPEQICEKAIDIAVTLMREQGFSKVRLTDVAREMDLSHAALYKHFANKEAILDAVSERWLRRLEEATALVVAKKKNALSRIREWFLILYQMKKEKVAADPELYASFNHAANVGKPFYYDHISKMLGQLTSLVKEAQSAGELKKYSPAKSTRILIEVTTGFHNPALVAQSLDENRVDLLKHVLDVAFSGLTKVD